MFDYELRFYFVVVPGSDGLWLACPDCKEPLTSVLADDDLYALSRVAQDHWYACADRVAPEEPF